MLLFSITVYILLINFFFFALTEGSMPLPVYILCSSSALIMYLPQFFAEIQQAELDRLRDETPKERQVDPVQYIVMLIAISPPFSFFLAIAFVFYLFSKERREHLGKATKGFEYLLLGGNRYFEKNPVELGG